MLKLKVTEKEIKRVITKTNAKLYRLRRQKRMWYEKIIKAINRNINNLAKLEKLKKKKR